MGQLTDLRWHTCTPENPWTPETGKRGIHPEAVEVGGQESGWPSGDIIRKECPVCGVSWKEELPQ